MSCTSPKSSSGGPSPRRHARPAVRQRSRSHLSRLRIAPRCVHDRLRWRPTHPRALASAPVVTAAHVALLWLPRHPQPHPLPAHTRFPHRVPASTNAADLHLSSIQRLFRDFGPPLSVPSECMWWVLCTTALNFFTGVIHSTHEPLVIHTCRQRPRPAACNLQMAPCPGSDHDASNKCSDDHLRGNGRDERFRPHPPRLCSPRRTYGGARRRACGTSATHGCAFNRAVSIRYISTRLGLPQPDAVSPHVSPASPRPRQPPPTRGRRRP